MAEMHAQSFGYTFNFEKLKINGLVLLVEQLDFLTLINTPCHACNPLFVFHYLD